MTSKYEPVFGDQSLFYTYDLDDTVIAISKYFQGKPANSSNGLHTFSQEYLDKNPDATEGAPLIAMRRVIKTPTWTRADREAGVLPPVGSIFTYGGETLTCHFIDGDGEIWAHDIYNKIVTPLLRDCQPIETSEEKAARLKAEWLLRAAGLCQFGKFLEGVYDALLSGELKAPTNE